jgi:pyrimidine operon attenuation protein/uracil phosphoribosyltransferase
LTWYDIFEARMKSRTLLVTSQLEVIIDRLCYQIIEEFDSADELCLIGLQPRGVYLSNRLKDRLKELAPDENYQFGALDITFHRDDFRRRETPLTPQSTEIPFDIENKTVILVDDVLYTGRTIRAGMDALMNFGRPSRVQLLVLIDRRFKRQLPIEANYVGQRIDSIDAEKVKVEWKEQEGKDQIVLFNTEENG